MSAGSNMFSGVLLLLFPQVDFLGALAHSLHVTSEDME